MNKLFQINHFLVAFSSFALLIGLASCKKNCSCTRTTIIEDTVVRVNVYDEAVKSACSELNKEEVATYNRPIDSTTFIVDTLHTMTVTCREQ
jgi:hypothetical protein